MNRFIATSPEKIARSTEPSFEDDHNGQLRRVCREATDDEVNFQLDHIDPPVHQIGSAEHKIEVAAKLNNLINQDERGLFHEHRIIDLQTGNHPNWHYQGVSTKFSHRETTAETVAKLVRRKNEAEEDRDIARDDRDLCYLQKHEMENELSVTRYRLGEKDKEMQEMRRQMEAMRQALIDNGVHPETFQPLQTSVGMTYQEAKRRFDNRHETVQFGDDDSDEF